MTEIKHEYGNWNVYVDGNPTFGFVYKQEAEAVAEMIDALYELAAYGGKKDINKLIENAIEVLKKAGCHE